MLIKHSTFNTALETCTFYVTVALTHAKTINQ